MNIEIFHTPSFAEYYRVMRRVVFKRFRVFLVLALVLPIMMALFTALQPQRPGSEASSISNEVWYSILVPVLFLVFLSGSLYFSCKKQWSKNQAIRESRRIVITEQGLDVKGETFSGRNEWINIAEGERNRDLFILRTRGGAYYLIPVRSFPSEFQVQEFSSFMRAKFGRAFKI